MLLQGVVESMLPVRSKRNRKKLVIWSESDYILFPDNHITNYSYIQNSVRTRMRTNVHIGVVQILNIIRMWTAVLIEDLPMRMSWTSVGLCYFYLTTFSLSFDRKKFCRVLYFNTNNMSVVIWLVRPHAMRSGTQCNCCNILNSELGSKSNNCSSWQNANIYNQINSYKAYLPLFLCFEFFIIVCTRNVKNSAKQNIYIYIYCTFVSACVCPCTLQAARHLRCHWTPPQVQRSTNLWMKHLPFMVLVALARGTDRFPPITFKCYVSLSMN